MVLVSFISLFLRTFYFIKTLHRKGKRVLDGYLVSLRYAVMTFKSHSSYGVHIVYHLTADRASLTGSEIAVVAVAVKVYANFVCCLHLDLLKSLLCLLVCHNKFSLSPQVRRFIFYIFKSAPYENDRALSACSGIILRQVKFYMYGKIRLFLFVFYTKTSWTSSI